MEVATLARQAAAELTEGVKTELLARITALEVKLESFKAEVATRFKAVDQRFDGIDQRIDGINQRFDQMDSRFDQMDSRFERMERHLDKIAAQFDSHLTSYRRLVMLLALPVALALLAGVGKMVWESLGK